jgi:MFS family permease
MAKATELTLPHTLQPSALTAAWWAVAARFLLHGLIVSTWVSRIPSLQSTLSLTNASLGVCLLGTAVGSVLGVPGAGWLVARFGSKQVAAWSTIGFCFALLAPALAVNAPTLFLALALYGLLAGANDVAINSQAVAVEAEIGEPTMSRFHALFSLGGMFGAGLGGLIAARGVAPLIHFGTAAIFFLVISACTAPFLWHSQNAARHVSRLDLRRIPRTLILLTIIGSCMFLSEGAVADWSGVYLKQVLLANPASAAAGYALFSTGMAIFRLFGDTVTRRLGPVMTVRAGALLAACGLTVALTAQAPVWALPGFALTGAGFSVIVPLAFSAGGNINSLPAGAAIATVSGSGYIGFLFGPPLIGFIAHASSLRAALFLLVGLSLLTAVLANAVDVTKQ